MLTARNGARPCALPCAPRRPCGFLRRLAKGVGGGAAGWRPARAALRAGLPHAPPSVGMSSLLCHPKSRAQRPMCGPARRQPGRKGTLADRNGRALCLFSSRRPDPLQKKTRLPSTGQDLCRHGAARHHQGGGPPDHRLAWQPDRGGGRQCVFWFREERRSEGSGREPFCGPQKQRRRAGGGPPSYRHSARLCAFLRMITHACLSTPQKGGGSVRVRDVGRRRGRPQEVPLRAGGAPLPRIDSHAPPPL